MSVRKSLGLSFLDRYSGLIITIGSTMVLARLLTPAQMGVFAVTMVFVSVLAGLRDFGASSYLIQEKQITDDKIRAAWMLQIGIGLLLGLVVAAIAVPVGNFYGEAEMTDILLLLSINFVINPIGTITIAWWMREMQYERIAVTRFFGAITGAIVSVTLAWQGWGPISLAWGSLATTLASIVLTTLLRPANLPGRPGIKEIRIVAAFGGKLSGATIVNSMAQGAPEVMIARFQGVTDAGLLSRATGLAGIFDQLIMNAVRQVILPLFSRNLREHKPVENLYFKGIELITGIGWPFFAVLAITAFPVMRILYGDQWDGAVEVAQILCLAAAAGLLSGFASGIILAYGRVGTILLLSIVGGCVKLILSVIGAYYGLISMGWLLFLHALVFSVASMIFLGRSIRPPNGKLFRVLGKSVAVTIITVAPVLAVQHAVGFGENEVNLLAFVSALSMAVVMFVVAAKVIRHDVYFELLNVMQMLRVMMSSKR